MALTANWYYQSDFTASATTTICDVVISWYHLGWETLVANCPDYKEFLNYLHLKIYRKLRFIIRPKNNTKEFRKPIIKHMMLQRPTFRGKMSHK